ncbi:aminotransferase class IV family protein [Streptomyces californicus]|uniref:aminotransferase class IV family protein n=1 Tax=Streptomyces californicus TaxID=67351 RepID=UPI0037B28C6A
MATLNGQPVSSEDLFPLAATNYGHFTSMRVDTDGIRGLGLHLDRLVRDCKTVWGADLDPDRVRGYVREALTGRERPCVVRVTVYDPTVDMGHPALALHPQILVSVRPAGPVPAPPLRVQSVRYQRDVPLVKHCGLFGALHARRSAQLAGFDDALFVDPDGYISEGGTWNVAFIDAEGTVQWPQADVLPGVTMALLQTHGAHRTRPTTLQDVETMQAAFATNTSIGVRPLSRIDDIELPTQHPVLDQLRDAYRSTPTETL